MIRENQKLLNYLNVLSDAVLLYISLPLAYYLHFHVLHWGVSAVSLRSYLVLGLGTTALEIFIFAAFGMYRSFRHMRLSRELRDVFLSGAVTIVLLLSALFLGWEVNYSRMTLAFFFTIGVILLSVKRIALRKTLRHWRIKGYNQRHILIVGDSPMAKRYLQEIRTAREFGYNAIGCVADTTWDNDLPCLGPYTRLDEVLERLKLDEVICALPIKEYDLLPKIIYSCEKAGVKLSVIPFYAEHMPAAPHFDSINGIPLWNLRRIPLDNWFNAFCKRATDIIVSGFGLLVLSPLLLVTAIGAKLSSPGPVFFKQERVGLNKKKFYMYKFRSMRINDKQDTGWSTGVDNRRTKFGSFIRKCSIDELPQLWNVLVGDMSLVGPRPEIPHFVEQFREEVPLYMVKHQVRPGITGWAQVNGYRGDTSIKARIEHDIYYIENWSYLFDIRILFMTVFGGKFLNDEKL